MKTLLLFVNSVQYSCFMLHGVTINRYLITIVLFNVGFLFASLSGAESISTARGYVFEDRNRNGIRDRGEVGLPKILVSNQREITVTKNDGSWELPVSDDTIFFIVKPSGWMTPVNHHNLPLFYYIHKPKGSPNLKFEGVKPTGALPASIDFPLHRQPEPLKFQAIFFGDPQPRDQKELDYIARDVVEELIGTEAKFGVTLGDILFDDLSLFDRNNAIISQIGVPWYNVIGNHDLNFDGPDDRTSDETFHRHFGPNYFAYEYGPVVFIALDNVKWNGAKPEGTGTYTSWLGEEQLGFLKNLLPNIPKKKLILFMMHIPIYQTIDKEELFRLIEDRPYTMSISGHTHWHGHRFLGEKDGWKGEKPHHHVINVTVSGSWWSGTPDESGIPHAMMSDGGPNGYTVFNFDREKAVIDYKAARRPANYQMNVFAPSEVVSGSSSSSFVYVNVFNGSGRSTVRMRVGRTGNWVALKKVLERDPYLNALKKQEKERPEILGRNLPEPKLSDHLWKAALPDHLTAGEYLISVQTEDMWGRIFHASRSIRVIANSTVDSPSKGR